MASSGTGGDICLGFGSIANGGASTAIGFQNTSSSTNSIAIGTQCVASGASSTAIGQDSQSTNTNGIAIGVGATCTGANSICIGADTGDGGNSNLISIGNSSATQTFITGIFGSTVSGSAVLCASDGMLGTVVSSERYKENIKPWQDDDNKLLRLSIKKFNYKSDTTKTTQYGLIAEEVEQIMPNLIVYGKDNRIESVKYHELPIFLLDIIQSQDALIQGLIDRLTKLEAK
jgi:hypothetical protein